MVSVLVAVVDAGELGVAGVGEPGGARPDERIGSEEPVRSEAAVAAAATLSRVPNTSMLPGDIAECGERSGDAGEGSAGMVVVSGEERSNNESLSELDEKLEGRDSGPRALLELPSRLAPDPNISLGAGRGTSVVCTIPCTTTSVPGGGNCLPAGVVWSAGACCGGVASGADDADCELGGCCAARASVGAASGCTGVERTGGECEVEGYGVDGRSSSVTDSAGDATFSSISSLSRLLPLSLGGLDGVEGSREELA